jgi:predicted RNase H-like nuclease (RuvC/YqgF family)
LQEYNHELQNQVKKLEWTEIQKKNIIDHMVVTIHSTNYLQNQIDMNDQLIDALQIKLKERKNQIDDMIDATFANKSIQKIDASCDTEVLIEKFDAICDT